MLPLAPPREAGGQFGSSPRRRGVNNRKMDSKALLLPFVVVAAIGALLTLHDQSAGGMLQGILTRFFWIFYIAYFVLAWIAHVAMGRRRGGWLVAAHAVALIGGLAIAAGTFYLAAESDRSSVRVDRQMHQPPAASARGHDSTAPRPGMAPPAPITSGAAPKDSRSRPRPVEPGAEPRRE